MGICTSDVQFYTDSNSLSFSSAEQQETGGFQLQNSFSCVLERVFYVCMFAAIEEERKRDRSGDAETVAGQNFGAGAHRGAAARTDADGHQAGLVADDGGHGGGGDPLRLHRHRCVTALVCLFDTLNVTPFVSSISG